MITKQFTITAFTGFARQASLLAGISGKVTSAIYIEYQEETVDLKKTSDPLMDVMSLGIRTGSQFSISAEGNDENQAIQMIEEKLSEMNIIDG